MTLPCHCIEPNMSCRRGGTNMIGRMYELCAGINCTAEMSEGYRRQWDANGKSVQVEAPKPRRPCKHFGQDTGEVRQCPTCAGTVKVKLFACDLHGSCTPEKPVPHVACCAPGQCKDYDAAPEGEPWPGMPLAEMIELVKGEPRSWPDGWSAWPVTQQAHRKLLDEADATENGFSIECQGRGILIGAGGSKYFSCAWVCVSVLRRLGCTLPVQFWYLGQGEMDPRMEALAGELGVECVDARIVAADLGIQPRILNGFEIKAFALLHTVYREVLWLDADNIPAVDPTFLFDTPQYKETGAVFWPDLDPWNRPVWIPRDLWDWLGIPFVEVRDAESGQVLIDKAKCLRELLVCQHLNEHSDWLYKHVYGDKTTFTLAWMKVSNGRGMTYAQPPLAGWVHPCIQQHDFSGRVIFNHACQGKSDLISGQRIDALGRAEWAVEAATALRKRWHYQPWSFEDQTEEETREAELIPGVYRYNRVGHDERLLQLLPNGSIGLGAAGCEQRWGLRILDGFLTLIIVGESTGTCFLRQNIRPEGLFWEGRWEQHERMPIEMVRT